MEMLNGMRIGDLAERCGVSRDALRFYERERLLPPPRRSASGYRLYREDRGVCLEDGIRGLGQGAGRK